jgi:hypothetical protein
MHKVTDAGAEMAERLKLMRLAHRLQLLRYDKTAHDQYCQDRQGDSQGETRSDL